MDGDNTLSLGSSAWKGTDIYKSLYEDDLKKNLQKAFSEDKNPKEEEKKEPTPEEAHKEELKHQELRRDHSEKMDRKHSYDGLDKPGQRALRVLVNIEGKSAKEKLESVMEHFGVSKLGAINMLADATKHLKDTIDETEKDNDSDKDSKEVSKSIDQDKNYLEKGRKALPVGTVNKHGQTKQGDGTWKYVKNGDKNMHEASQKVMNEKRVEGTEFKNNKTYSPNSDMEVLSFSGKKNVKLSSKDELTFTGQVIPIHGESHHILHGSNKKVAIPVSELDTMRKKFSEIEK